jgi:hypothetical protein
VSLAGTVASGVTGAIGAQQKGRAEAQAANYQAAVARNNAIIQQQNAAQAAATGRARAQQQDFVTRGTLGAIAAAQGASGIDIGSPSFQQVTTGEQQAGRLKTENVMQQALLQARGYDVEAMRAQAGAQLDVMQAAQAQRAAGISATGSILGGATSFADKWARYQTPSGTRSTPTWAEPYV